MFDILGTAQWIDKTSLEGMFITELPKIAIFTVLFMIIFGLNPLYFCASDIVRGMHFRPACLHMHSLHSPYFTTACVPSSIVVIVHSIQSTEKFCVVCMQSSNMCRHLPSAIFVLCCLFPYFYFFYKKITYLINLHQQKTEQPC